MRNDKVRRFRPRTNKYRSRRSSNGMNNNGSMHQINLQRNNVSRNPHNLERIIEKYKNLAKEALATGDKILHENYLQHSDHFSRILSEVESSKPKVSQTQDTKSIQDTKANIAVEWN